MGLETNYSDYFIDHYLDSQIETHALGFSLDIEENGIHPLLGFSIHDVYHLYSLALDIVHRFDVGEKVPFVCSAELLEGISKGAWLEWRFLLDDNGVTVDFNETPLPNSIPSDGHYHRNDYLYG